MVPNQQKKNYQGMRRRKIFQNYPIDGIAFSHLFNAGLAWLRTNQEIVNVLNVFPVPDGDTGTNMVLTMQSAMDEIENSTERHIGKLVGSLANGALMGARGNSGVILSQLWRGFAKVLEDDSILTGESLVEAFRLARDMAYKGVVHPVEGTILTVSHDIAVSAEKALEETTDPFEILDSVVDEAFKSVERTPELLQVLKDAGVVDSGGKGLYFIIEGMQRYVYGLGLEETELTVQPLSALNLEEAMQAVEEGQDYEVVVDFIPTSTLDLQGYYSNLEAMGTSIQVGEGDGLFRMHIHVPTDKRYDPIDYTMTLGTVTKVAIENLIAQMQSDADTVDKIELTQVEPEEIAVIAVVPGIGIARVFASLGVAAIIEGGQTMNPSTKDIKQAIDDLPTDKVIILPNNKNIVMASESASDMSEKTVSVVPSKTVPQGLSAMLRLTPTGKFEEVVADMNEAINDVETGEITTATRSVEINNVEVEEGQIIALHNGKLVFSGSTLEETCLGLLEIIGMDEYELITLFTGENVPNDMATTISEAIQISYPNAEIEIQDGGQPHYQFIISIE